MERNFRFRVSGLAFIIVFFLNLALASSVITSIPNLFTNNKNNLDFLQILLGTILVIFTSDTIGYIFNSIWVFIFNRCGGYSGKLEKRLGYSGFRNSIVQNYDSMNIEMPNDFPHNNFRHKLDTYNTEHFFVNFFWHRSELPSNLNEWLERRYNAYFISYSCVTALVTATFLSIVFICGFSLGMSPWNIIIIVVTLIIIMILIWNGEDALKDAIAITDLHIAEYVNPRIKKMLNQYQVEKTK